MPYTLIYHILPVILGGRFSILKPFTGVQMGHRLLLSWLWGEDETAFKDAFLD